MPTPPLTTVPKVKAYLRINDTENSDDGLIQLLAGSANAAIISAMSRNLLSSQYSETYGGTGTGTLVLPNFPITAVGSVSIVSPRSFANAPQSTTPLVQGVDYTFTQYAIKRYCGVFPRGVANIVVEYTAGFATYPGDIVHVATKWAALRYRELERLGQKSKTLQGETVSFDLDELAPDMLAIVNRYQPKIPLIAQPVGLI